MRPQQIGPAGYDDTNCTGWGIHAQATVLIQALLSNAYSFTTSVPHQQSPVYIHIHTHASIYLDCRIQIWTAYPNLIPYTIDASSDIPSRMRKAISKKLPLTYSSLLQNQHPLGTTSPVSVGCHCSLLCPAAGTACPSSWTAGCLNIPWTSPAWRWSCLGSWSALSTSWSVARYSRSCYSPCSLRLYSSSPRHSPGLFRLLYCRRSATTLLYSCFASRLPLPSDLDESDHF